MKIDAKGLKEAYISAFHNLHNVYPEIDKLNVFPVPDGDTGTNMNLTLSNAVKDINDLEPTALDKMANAFARGLIMGARGNSGVIFSQIFKGFAEGLKGYDEITGDALVKALAKAKEVAYKAVMKPVEGTILTVIRETAEQMEKEDCTQSVEVLFNKVCEYANESLSRTPELLPVLKEVGVVDSGGFGLVKALEGMNAYFQTGKIVEKLSKVVDNSGNNVAMNIENEEFGYCTEAIVILNDEILKGSFSVEKVRKTLEDQGGKSIVAVRDEEILKVHVHTLQPGTILTFLQQYGEFKNIKVENMNMQADKHVKNIKKERLLANAYAIIAVAPSDGLVRYFKKDLNVTAVINGGVTMNPSTDDFIKMIEEVDAKEVYLLPNNSNVILSAQQAAKVEKKSSVHVIPTTSIPEGMVAAISFDPSESGRKNATYMKQALRNVKSVSVTKAAKDAVLDGVEIKNNDYMGIVNKKIMISNPDIKTVLNFVLDRNISKTNEIVTIFAGEDAQVSELNYIKKHLDENFDVEYEVVRGEQPLYNYIFSIE